MRAAMRLETPGKIPALVMHDTPASLAAAPYVLRESLENSESSLTSRYAARFAIAASRTGLERRRWKGPAAWTTTSAPAGGGGKSGEAGRW